MTHRHLLCDWNPERTICCVVHSITDVRVGHIYLQDNGCYAVVGHNTEFPPQVNLRSEEEALEMLDEMRKRQEYPQSYIEEAQEEMEAQWDDEQQEVYDAAMHGGDPFDGLH